MTEDDNDRRWECTKVLKFSEEKGVNGSTSHNCLVEWNDMNKSQLWANFFALNLRDLIPIISFSRKNTIWIRFPSSISYNTAILNHQQIFQRYRRFQPTRQVECI
jgi:hypothetical protein